MCTIIIIEQICLHEIRILIKDTACLNDQLYSTVGAKSASLYKCGPHVPLRCFGPLPSPLNLFPCDCYCLLQSITPFPEFIMVRYYFQSTIMDCISNHLYCSVRGLAPGLEVPLSADLLLLKAHLRRLPVEIREEVKRAGYWARGPKHKIAWILALGRTNEGWATLKSLFEHVELRNETAALSFFETCTGNWDTGWYFAGISKGESTTMLKFTKNLQLSFDIGHYMDDMCLFRVLFMHWLPRLRCLETLTFEMEEWMTSAAFILMTQPGMEYPSSLHTIQMISRLTDVSKASSLPWQTESLLIESSVYCRAWHYRHSISPLDADGMAGTACPICRAGPPDSRPSQRVLDRGRSLTYRGSTPGDFHLEPPQPLRFIYRWSYSFVLPAYYYFRRCCQMQHRRGFRHRAL